MLPACAAAPHPRVRRRVRVQVLENVRPQRALARVDAERDARLQHEREQPADHPERVAGIILAVAVVVGQRRGPVLRVVVCASDLVAAVVQVLVDAALVLPQEALPPLHHLREVDVPHILEPDVVQRRLVLMMKIMPARIALLRIPWSDRMKSAPRAPISTGWMMPGHEKESCESACPGGLKSKLTWYIALATFGWFVP